MPALPDRRLRSLRKEWPNQLRQISMPDIKKAMVLAAGYGTRLKPLTDRVPKPLVPVAGKPMIQYALEKLQAYGIEQIVINVSHLKEQLVAWLADRKSPAVTLSEEAEPLETGGGLKKALPLLGDEPVFVINSDIIWTDDLPSPREREKVAEGRMRAVEQKQPWPGWRAIGTTRKWIFCCLRNPRPGPSATTRAKTIYSSKAKIRSIGMKPMRRTSSPASAFFIHEFCVTRRKGNFPSRFYGTGRSRKTVYSACRTMAAGTRPARWRTSKKPRNI